MTSSTLTGQEQVLVRAEGLRKLFPLSRGILARIMSHDDRFVHAVDNVTFTIGQGEILGLVGESGCGKTTTGRLLALLETPTEGKILYAGTDLAALRGGEIKPFRRQVQVIFQDPYQTLDPRYTVLDAVAEPLRIHGIGNKDDQSDRVLAMLEHVDLKPAEQFAGRYPHELSGGQRQRVAIARAMILEPRFIVADEPVSMLDISIRAGVMNLMLRLKQEFGVGYLFITHDLSVARYMSDRIAVMYLGRIVEVGPKEDVILNPRHPYTRILLSAVAVPDPRTRRDRVQVAGEPPNAVDLPNGCRFHPRCPQAQAVCREAEPSLAAAEPGRSVACYFA